MHCNIAFIYTHAVFPYTALKRLAQLKFIKSDLAHLSLINLTYRVRSIKRMQNEQHNYI